MRSTAALAALSVFILTADALSYSNTYNTNPNGHKLIAKRLNKHKRCEQRFNKVPSADNPLPSGGGGGDSNSFSVESVGGAGKGGPGKGNGGGSKPPPPPPPPPPSHQDGTINVDSTCGDIRATTDSSGLSGPNGHIDWINCGLQNEGWRPQMVTVNDVISANLRDVLNNYNNPFSACGDYIGLFEQYGGQFGLPPILLASFAMQESGCRPWAMGGGGEVGLMQISPDKCGDAPGGNCNDVDYNIRTGAQFFRNTLDASGGNLFKAIGNYNGWRVGMHEDDARSAQFTGCCRCQQNLDYIHQFVNGWLLGKDAQNPRLGKYFNLDVC